MKNLFLLCSFFLAISQFSPAQSIVEADYLISGRDSLPQNGEFVRDSLFFFDAATAALRGGVLYDSRDWSPDSLGHASLAFGYDTRASGWRGAIALGVSTRATGMRGATALGRSTFAQGNNGATALGRETWASGHNGATAMGSGSIAQGNDGAIAMGLGTTASGNAGSIAMGYGTVARGNNGAAAIGFATEVTANSCIVSGVYNDTIVMAGTDPFTTPTSPLFIVGNGSSNVSRSNALVVLKNGNTGIGTNTPQADLEIKGTDDTDAIVFDNGQGAIRHDKDVFRWNRAWFQILLDADDDENDSRFAIFNDVNSGAGTPVVAFYMDGHDSWINGGHLGIGTTTPNDKLDVVGDIDATGCVQTDNTGTIGGTCLSDRRLKKNIASLSNQLQVITALNPVSFEWIEIEENNSSTPEIGLIAQEVEEVLPEMVREDEEGYKRVRYDISLQMRMIQAMKEQQEIIEAQAAAIQELQAAVQRLEADRDT